MITFRKAITTTDAETLLALRNDPLTRANSRNHKKVSRREHFSWLARSTVEGRHNYIALLGDQAVGSGRLEVLPDQFRQAEVSLTLHPAHRGKGLAHPLIKALTQEGKRLNLKTLFAVVRPTNLPSLIAFLKAGYVIYSADREFVVLERTP